MCENFFFTIKTVCPKIEGEFDFSANYAIGKFCGAKNAMGAGDALEIRYNIPESNLDCGLRIDMNSTRFIFYDNRYESDNKFYKSNLAFGYVLVSDYNFRQGSILNPYAGLGLGMGYYESEDFNNYSKTGVGPILRPRAGIEIYHHIRLGISGTLFTSGFNHIDVSLGVVVGGRPIKKRHLK